MNNSSSKIIRIFLEKYSIYESLLIIFKTLFCSKAFLVTLSALKTYINPVAIKITNSDIIIKKYI